MLGDDAELTAAVLAAQTGDEDAFRAVYRAVHPRLIGYVRTLVGEADAEDVASESWLQIARDIDRFSGDADRFRGWAARIARNRALDHIRMRGRRPAVGGDETELTGRPADCDTAAEAMEALSTGTTMALIARLPQDQAEAVVLRVVMGLDAKSAAEALGKRPGAVRTAAHRGLKRLAELIGDRPAEAEVPSALPEAAGPAVPAPRSGAAAAGPERASGTGAPAGPAPEGEGPAAPAPPASGPAEGRKPQVGGGAVTLPQDAPAVGDLDGLPPQRARGTGATASTGVTQWRPRTQKDM
ncbi:RNA polymerase sigma factor [Streptomyces sp. C10-9-1]|uniref:RNA polymerase sigma factor n=1 Tax=Streptomyces sp. C10-9-1 TaxID=1859285 RepID=UPI0021126B7A|nr:RNA polymerase sigma factor [Streptomyces sp. C10-9-1]MCQ6556990.1 RNA polymerase sigma factor [Streptomyces sp. C10-9-1]